VTDGDVRFLDTLRILRGHVKKKINLFGDCATSLASERNQKSAASASGVYSANDVWTRTAGGESYKNIVRGDERFNLPGENAFKSIVVACGSEHGRVSGERQRCEATTIVAQPYDKLGREMQRIGRASTVSEEDNFSARAERGCTLFNELSDAFDKLGGKAKFNASAFLELAPYFISG
jgi:hypothetical protein